MKKRLFIMAAFITIASVLTCRSGPEPADKSDKTTAAFETKTRQLSENSKITDHKRSSYDEEVPDWIFSEQAELETLPDYEGTYVFKFSNSGKELEELEDWSRSFPADSAIAGVVSTRAMRKFEEAELEGKDLSEPYMKEITNILEVAEYAGTRRKSDYWVYIQTSKDSGKPDEKIYLYYLIFTVPKIQIQSAIDRAIKNEEQKKEPETEGEQAALDSIKLLFNEGF